MLYCPGSGQELFSALGVVMVCQDFQELSNTIIAFVDDGGVIKINDMPMGPCVICNPGAFGRCFDVSYIFLFPRN